MTDGGRVHLAIAEQMDVEEARRAARSLAVRLHFGATDAEVVALAVSELATNLVRYATGGEIVVVALDGSHGRGIEIRSSDRGPGIADLNRALDDGHSTGGGLGNGLGGVRRLMDEFELTSGQSGTRVVCRKWRQKS